jgi:hypothetical protein
MNICQRNTLSLYSAIAIGLGVSTGYPLGMIAAAAMPLACLAAGTRKAASKSTFGYYATALWPIIPGLEAYWKSATPLIPVMLWILTAVILAVPWTIAWTSHRLHYLWRAPLALLATIVPPLGIVGLASPLTGAGYLFPSAGWTGLAAVALLPGIILSTRGFSRPVRCVVVFLSISFWTGVAVAGGSIFHPRDAEPPRGWIAVNTHFGDVSQPFRDFHAAQFIQRKAAQTPARVLIFPESVVPRWSPATEAFWQQSLDRYRRRGQILAFGAGLPPKTGAGKDELEKLNDLKSYDFDAAIDVLKTMDTQSPRTIHRSWISNAQVKPEPEPVDNALLLVGAESAAFYQRVPVPLGMWRPFSKLSVPLRLNGPGVLVIDHQRAAVLICYEQILTFPILVSMLQHPTVVIGISNTFWIDHTTTPRYQANALRAWAKLFRLPYLSAVNS